MKNIKFKIIILLYLYNRFLFHFYNSKIAAAPIPVPMHILTKPYFPFVLFNSGNKVETYLAPVQPKGCPKAMAPPFGLTFFQSIPNFSMQYVA